MTGSRLSADPAVAAQAGSDRPRSRPLGERQQARVSHVQAVEEPADHGAWLITTGSWST
jgi:hypothetical protein